MSDIPAKPSQIVVGARVKLIYKGLYNTKYVNYGKIGKIVKIDSQGLYYIQYDDGSIDASGGWNNADSCSILQEDVPATASLMVPGTRVKCIYKHHGRTDKTGTVEGLISSTGNYKIKWDDGYSLDPYGWSEAASFTILQEDIPATKEQMVVGARVKCIFTLPGGPIPELGKIGTVAGLNKYGHYLITWDDGTTQEDGTGFADPASFTILSPQDISTTTAPSEVAEQKPEPTFDFDAYNGRPSRIRG